MVVWTVDSGVGVGVGVGVGMGGVLDNCLGLLVYYIDFPLLLIFSRVLRDSNLGVIKNGGFLKPILTNLI